MVFHLRPIGAGLPSATVCGQIAGADDPIVPFTDAARYAGANVVLCPECWAVHEALRADGGESFVDRGPPAGLLSTSAAPLPAVLEAARGVVAVVDSCGSIRLPLLLIASVNGLRNALAAFDAERGDGATAP